MFFQAGGFNSHQGKFSSTLMEVVLSFIIKKSKKFKIIPFWLILSRIFDFSKKTSLNLLQCTLKITLFPQQASPKEKINSFSWNMFA